MSEDNIANIIGALITAAGSIIGAVIGARALKEKGNSPSSEEKSYSFNGILGGALIGAFLSVVLLLLTGLLSIPKFAFKSDINDEFDNPKYQATFDTDIWYPIRHNNDKIFQQNGFLTVSDIADNDGGVVLNFRDDQINEFSFFEAKVKMSDKVIDGTGSSLVLMVTSPSIPFSNHLWFGIEASPTYRVTVSKGGTGENLISKEFDTKEWHILGVEFSKNTRKINFILDGESIFTYKIPGSEPISIIPALQFWHDERSLFEGYVDYVKLTR